MSPSIEILEQPAVEKLRFRYKSEKPCSVLEGITSSKEKKTYPTIRIIDYTGMASIDISLVTHTDPYRYVILCRGCVMSMYSFFDVNETLNKFTDHILTKFYTKERAK